MISREEVLKIAKLARLDLSETEIERYQTRLGRVFEYIKELNAVPTEKGSLVKHVPKDAVAFREDRALPFNNVSGLLENAPALEGAQFLLPTIVEHS
jgi:aspartyl-tRNA(Asn)/glutamyl-tRNA(Gln) amidotransferase subunit C